MRFFRRVRAWLWRRFGVRWFDARIVRVEWVGAIGPVVQRFPSRLELWGVRRDAAGRREINDLLGTNNWLWGPGGEIRAVARERIPPKGGSGTAPVIYPPTRLRMG